MAYGYGTTIGAVLNSWVDMGVFAYLLPFLMIFALVYGILSKSKILGENKGVHATISVAVGLLALQFNYVSNFFATIFPYTGIGLAVLLVALILMGLISPDQGAKAQWIWFGIGVVIFIIVVLSSIENFWWWGGGYGVAQSWPAILSLVILLGVMALIVFPKWGR
ncbi:hypothetical protein GF386_02560 [Candidatus Pacearchaeota archaeon]|nr:hypothetical protein [Candidatus Pacearchaeota archaeon]MBD3283026.1 hypothetical protein [Candidatus Pacearchaeota archaeon]